MPINPEWYEEWRALPCLLNQPTDCAYNVFSFLGLLSLEEAQRLADLSPEGFPFDEVQGFIEQRYTGLEVARVEQADGESFEAFINRIFPLLTNGFAYIFYFYREAELGHYLVVYKNNDRLQLVDPQVNTLTTISSPDQIQSYIDTIHPPPSKLGVFIPNLGTEPLVPIEKTIQQRSIGATVETGLLARGVEVPKAKIAGQAASTIDWDKVPSNIRFKPYSLVSGEPGSVADILVERIGLEHLHQVCFGLPLPLLRLDDNYFLVYVDKKVGQTYVYASMLLANIASPDQVILYSVGTDPNFRGKGMFKGLLRTLEQHLTTHIPSINVYSLHCDIRTLNKVTFLQRFQIYSNLGFKVQNGVTVTIQQFGFGGLQPINVVINSSLYVNGRVMYSVITTGVIQTISYESIISIPEQPGLVHGVAVPMDVSRDVLRQRLGLVAEPGGGAGAGAAMPEGEYKGGTRKKRHIRRRKHTRRR